MSATVVLKAVGLNNQPNQLDQQSTPPGSLTEASNIIIRRDNVIESRRGYQLYGEAFGTSSDRAKQLMTYQGRILRHFSNHLQYDTLQLDSNSQSIFDTFCGTYLEPETGRRIRFIESNGNFYFTTSNGIEKISALTAADFTTACPYIIQAGGINALDLSAKLDFSLGSNSGFLPQDSAVAYRQVWGLTDANNNEILGTPSARVIVVNPLISLQLSDFSNLLLQLNNVSSATPASLINANNYYSLLNLPSNASPQELLTNAIALAAKLDQNILYADQVSGAPLQIEGAAINGTIATMNFSTGNPANYFISGDNVFLNGFTTSVGTIDGPQVISTLIPAYSTTGTTTTGVTQVTKVTTVADVTNSLAGTYFTIDSANDVKSYYVWYNVSGNGLDPSISGLTGIRVNINTNDTANTIATATGSAITAQASADFTTSVLTNVITVTNSLEGPATNAFAGTSGFTVAVFTSGVQGNLITSIGSITGINIGSFIHGTGIPTGSYVTNIGVGTITISQDVTSNNVAEALTFDAGFNFNISATAATTTTPGVPLAVGPVSTLNATITSYNYEIIPQPASPGTPASDQQLVDIQNYIQAIITRLQSEPSTGTPPVISSFSQTNFITSLQVTSSANVLLTFTIPSGVTVNDFYQIYRSQIVSATGASSVLDIIPNDELRLVIEGFPTPAQIAAGTITILDQTPQSFAGAFLYTNATTGEGILQSNDVPPFALDINKFKNVIFYANTRTKFQQAINLLGVANMITDFNNGIIPTITVTNGTTTTTYTFVIGIQQVINIVTVADVSGNLAGKYFTFWNANNTTEYYVWYNVNGVGTDPALAGLTGIEVFLNTNETANNVAIKTSNTIGIYNFDFSSTFSTNHVIITNANEGPAHSPANGTSGFTSSVTTAGTGANPALNQILLSNVISPAQSVDQTARSLVNIINLDPNSSVYAFYISGTGSVPGQIELQARTLDNSPFYILANNSNTGSSFNPDISPSGFITNISVATQAVITTSAPHGLINGEQVVITNTNSTPNVNGLYTITYISPTTFSIPVTTTIAGNRGSFSAASNTLTATNNAKSNRIYYSKLLQPEAVPALNFIDVGAQNKAILRIFPLRDSLFVYKEDGLFRISGETAPFNLALFDSSCILIAPDSLDISNNLIYGWTRQGIQTTSESGVTTISRPIDIDILKLATNQYTNFKTATWGIGYESDNSYTTYTVQQTDDVYATIGYRYSTLTNTWTTFNKTNTCGVINSVDDTQYLGAGDVNFLEQERKNFNRYDYADRQFNQQLQINNYFGNQIQLADVTNIAIGDVITQDQLVSIYLFNALLEKLNLDVLLSPHTYVVNNTFLPGSDPRLQLDALITQIANDPGRIAQAGFTPIVTYTKYEAILSTGTVTSISAGNPAVITTSSPHGLQTGRIITISGSNSTPLIDGTYAVSVLTNNTFTIPVSVTQSGTTGSFSVNNSDFKDIQASYNGVINTLNNDTGVAFSNYNTIVNDTLQELIVIDVNPSSKRVTVNNVLDLMVGPLTIFKAINSEVTWAPVTFNDPISIKHIREAQLLFENRAFTNATLSFSSDLNPAFTSIPFLGTGNGIFGYTGIPASVNGIPGPTGFGYGFFGGASNSSPFRTYIPRVVQRCRFLNVQFNHNAAREQYAIFGLTITMNDGASSSRGYR